MVSLVLASTSASIPQFVAQTELLVRDLPEPHCTILRDYGAQLRYEEPEYLVSAQEFYRRHLCRLDPWPTVLADSMDEEAKNQSYAVLSGPNDLIVTGKIRRWDRGNDLGQLTMPTLVTCGRYDAITPPCSETIAAGAPAASLVVFEESAHVPHLEEPELYAATVDAFVATVDG